MVQRLRLACLIFFALASPEANAQPTCLEVLSALDASSIPVLSCNLNPVVEDNQVRILSSLGQIRPINGETFVVFSTGDLDSPPEPGVRLAGSDCNWVTPRILFRPLQPGRVVVSFWYRILTAEYPEQVGTSGAPFDNADAFGSRLSYEDPIAGPRTERLEVLLADAVRPVSAAEAEGTSFDLFSADPSGTDSEFTEIGLPDAGMSDWTLYTTEIDLAEDSQNSPFIQWFFDLQDGPPCEDGLRDSVVLLDNFSIGSLDVVDLNDVRYYASGSFTTDPEVLVAGGERRFGAAADGVTPLLLKSFTPESGTVVFSIDGAAPADGGIDVVGGSQRLNQLVVATTETQQGHVALAQYRVPDEFRRNASDDSLLERFIGVSATFTPSSGGQQESEFSLRLVRPPLVFIHGLWSGRVKWQFPIVSDERFPVRWVAGYPNTSARELAANRGVLRRNIASARTRMRSEGVATTQVDVVAHSMGGLLSRIWTTDIDYQRDDNLGTGDIRKLMTLDSPHLGTPLANALALARDLPAGIGEKVTQTFRNMKKPIDEGAIDDLSVGSTAIAAISASPVPSHALVGTGGSDLLDPPGLNSIFKVIDFFGDIVQETVFGGMEHDIVVAVDSQQGGLSSQAHSTFGFGDGLHCGVDSDPAFPGNTGSVHYAARLFELSGEPRTGADFDLFPAPTSVRDPQDPLSPTVAAVRGTAESRVQEGTNDLEIAAPSPGAVVTPGQDLTVSLTASGSSGIVEVLVQAADRTAVVSGSPLDLLLSVPEDYVGPLTISAFGKNVSEVFFTAESVVVDVVPVATLDDIQIEPRFLSVEAPGGVEVARVFGVYSDGVERDVTDLAGLELFALDADLLIVRPGGELTALKSGETILIARFAALQDSVAVSVTELPGLLFADGFETGDTSGWDQILP